MRSIAVGLLLLGFGCGRINIDPFNRDGGASGDSDSGDAPRDGAMDDWWDASWQHRIKLVLSNPGGIAIPNFPLLVTLDPSRIEYADTSAQGDDLRFIDGDGVTELSYDIEQWAPGGTSFVWVRVPQVQAGDDHLWLYYGNASATGARAPGATWAGHALVYHLDEVPLGGGQNDIADSSGNNNDGATQGAMPAGAQAAGIIGGALTLDGTDDFITAPSSASLRILGDITLQVWANIATFRAQWLFDFCVLPPTESETGNHLYELVLDSGDRLEMGWEYGSGNDETLDSTSSIATGASQWVLLTAVRSNGLNELRYYENGLPLGTTVSFTNVATGGTASTFYLAGEIDGTTSKLPFAGRIDEARIFPGARDSAFIRLDYLSMTDQVIQYTTPERY